MHTGLWDGSGNARRRDVGPQVLLALRNGKVFHVLPEVLHHNHFHHLNDGWYNVTNNWTTKRDTAWGERYGRALEEAVIRLARNLSADAGS
jgi:hypothetical protein